MIRQTRMNGQYQRKMQTGSVPMARGEQTMNDDLISRAAASKATNLDKDCNPDHFPGHEKFIQFMDDVEIGGFGNWQFANGFNLGLTAAAVAIKNLPPAERRGKWVPYEFGNRLWHKCTACGVADKYIDQVTRADGTICELVAKRPYCPNCGAKMEGAERQRAAGGNAAGSKREET